MEKIKLDMVMKNRYITLTYYEVEWKNFFNKLRHLDWYITYDKNIPRDLYPCNLIIINSEGIESIEDKLSKEYAEVVIGKEF